MSDERLPLAHELTPKAKKAGIATMQAHLSRRSGRPRSQEDARAAFENLLGFYTTVCEWKARAILEDRDGVASSPAPPPRTHRRKGSRGPKATNPE
jgi:hypothetical protein